MTKVAVFGGSGYLASIIKHQNINKKNSFIFFSKKKINHLFFDKKFSFFRKFDYIIHLAGPNQNQLKKDKDLIKKKNQLTKNICQLCLDYNIKLIYVSTMQVYNDYGKKNIYLNSKINRKNLYSKSHYESEKIIKKKFANLKKKFVILRLGNVFGFKKCNNMKYIKNNLIHEFCLTALSKKLIKIKHSSIQRNFVPSSIFFKTIDYIIKKKAFENVSINIFYKNFNLKEISVLIQKRIRILFNLKVKIIAKNVELKKNLSIYCYKNFNFFSTNKKILNEIDKILIFLKDNLNDIK
jgi:nucleoside-diphosphate-sugar epimerase